MSINKAIVDLHTAEPLSLSANECTVYSHASVGMVLTAGSGFPADTVHIDSVHGALYITSYRVVYVADARQGTAFASFSCAIDDEQVALQASDEYTAVMTCILVDGGQLASVTFAFPGRGDPQFAAAAFHSARGGATGAKKE